MIALSILCLYPERISLNQNTNGNPRRKQTGMQRRSNFLILVIATFFSPVNIDSATAGTPFIVAHRGLLKVAPENTLANFRACLELRLGFEFDVQRTKDGHLVCIHDTTVNRTTNGSGNVSDLTLAEVKQLDAGSWFDPRFAGEKVPTVEQVLQLASEYQQHPILIAVDFKDANVEQDVVRLAEKAWHLEPVDFHRQNNPRASSSRQHQSDFGESRNGSCRQ